jgi:hypothetical protein
MKGEPQQALLVSDAANAVGDVKEREDIPGVLRVTKPANPASLFDNENTVSLITRMSQKDRPFKPQGGKRFLDANACWTSLLIDLTMCLQADCKSSQ